MNTSLPLYALGGAVSFCLLSAIATKYRGEDIISRNLIRDSVAGALFTAFVLFLVPDMFPPIILGDAIKMTGGALAAVAAATSSISNSNSNGSSNNADSNNGGLESNIIKYDDYDLQVGYPKKRAI